MESLGITSFDLVVIVIAALSAIYGLVRGFTHEILSLLAWVAAAIVTLYALPLAQPFLYSWIEPESLADVVGVVVIGILSLIIFKLIAGLVGNAVKASPVGVLDRVLGALFGLLRGIFIICVAYLVISWLIPAKKLPEWILNAKSRPLVEYGASMIASITPAELIEDFDEATKRGLDKTMIDTVKERLPGQRRSDPNDPERTEQGYPKNQREDLDSLIERNI